MLQRDIKFRIGSPFSRAQVVRPKSLASVVKLVVCPLRFRKRALFFEPFAVLPNCILGGSAMLSQELGNLVVNRLHVFLPDPDLSISFCAKNHILMLGCEALSTCNGHTFVPYES